MSWFMWGRRIETKFNSEVEAKTKTHQTNREEIDRRRLELDWRMN